MTKIPKQHIVAHGMAFFCAFVWGITYISSKILLEWYTPLEIMLLRFTLAYLSLILIYPKIHWIKNLKEELIFVLAALTGVVGYFLLENSALVYTTVSNTGLILTSAPLFVALVAHVFTEDERFHSHLFIGFVVAIIGVGFIVYNGQINLGVKILGDLLALGGSFIWAFYSLAIKKMKPELSILFITKRTFFYSLIFMYGLFYATDGQISLEPLFTDGVWIHVLFLGLFASALCYVLWSQAIRIIGSVKTSSYIYLMPLFTMLAAYVVLKERITTLMSVGGLLILLGVIIAERGEAIKGFYRKCS